MNNQILSKQEFDRWIEHYGKKSSYNNEIVIKRHDKALRTTVKELELALKILGRKYIEIGGLADCDGCHEKDKTKENCVKCATETAIQQAIDTIFEYDL